MPYKDSSDSNLQTAPAWDLRVKYVEIVGSILEEIAKARLQNNYSEWFKLIDDNLFVEVAKKMDEEEIKEYYKIRNICVDIMNKHPTVLSGHKIDAHCVGETKEALKRLDIWIGHKMEECNLFGKPVESESDEGL